ncbi:hypothetical protein [Egicoccus sp. AB-alg2]|uniref:hypothetical protein n=1 Tax=Egicoccus sp. AB-alg2 TaxID=3242693 RepID=UPI00359D0062
MLSPETMYVHLEVQRRQQELFDSRRSATARRGRPSRASRRRAARHERPPRPVTGWVWSRPRRAV